MQKLVVLVAMLALLLAMAVPALATGNNQNAQSWVAYGNGSGGDPVGFTEGSSGVIVNDIQQTAESGDITSSSVLAD